MTVSVNIGFGFSDDEKGTARILVDFQYGSKYHTLSIADSGISWPASLMSRETMLTQAAQEMVKELECQAPCAQMIIRRFLDLLLPKDPTTDE